MKSHCQIADLQKWRQIIVEVNRIRYINICLQTYLWQFSYGDSPNYMYYSELLVKVRPMSRSYKESAFQLKVKGDFLLAIKNISKEFSYPLHWLKSPWGPIRDYIIAIGLMKLPYYLVCDQLIIPLSVFQI